MNVQWNSVRLFQRFVLVWVMGFLLSAYWDVDHINTMLRSPDYLPPGPLKYITHALSILPDGIEAIVVLVLVPVVVLLCIRDIVRAPQWWSSLLIWFGYVNLMNNAWLAGSGGQQLMANLLLWSAVLVAAGSNRAGEWMNEHMTVCAFWIMRIQLLVAYAATGTHKLTGAHWLDGSAIGVVSSDAAFGPSWMTEHTTIAQAATWIVLVFQLTFPIAVWWKRLRLFWMGIGIAFHLATALWMDIPEMGLAFIAAYPIWLDDASVLRWKLTRRLSLP
ncbi:MAG TPA: HTTM domain-containing protein [Flavobacteriales bacterium]|nr:HTTM domain-containing protein [Flavobacteriales bacterium]